MKNNFFKIKYILPVVFLAAGCTKNFDTINANPDKSTTSNEAWLANSMLTSITSSDITSTKGFCQPFMLGKYVLWTEMVQAFQYNSITRGNSGFGRMTVLRNIDPMLQFAQQNDSANVLNSYKGLAHFIRAWQFFNLTMLYGDIPYSEAAQGESTGNIKPKYDTQKEVFAGILNELDSANILFSQGANFSGDFIYSGNADQWRRLVNSFELRVLMQLYKKTSDADLNVINRFKDIASNRPLMRDYTDNFAVTYQNAAGYCYPWSNTAVQVNSFVIYPMLSTTLIDSLKSFKDRRLFYFAEPASTQISGGLSASDWNAYVGVEPSALYATTIAAHNSGNFCDFNKRYVNLYNTEPVGLMNYWDVQFLLAEAAVRGWLPASSAEGYYEAGITGSMHFLMHYTTSAYTHGMNIDDSYITSYLPTVKLAGSSNNQIQQILEQKYLANFMQDCDYTTWFENRRTGYPVFILNSSTNLNLPNTKMPVRWMYPQSELDNNGTNVAAAIQSQYSGTDDNNGTMWILQ